MRHHRVRVAHLPPGWLGALANAARGAHRREEEAARRRRSPPIPIPFRKTDITSKNAFETTLTMRTMRMSLENHFLTIPNDVRRTTLWTEGTT